ncbi:WD40-repeat-containing domain protein [Gorgonomyces haynaldii]|nr:WD40-repeat-containing domain protein [Gorgonomyces haynaldii]
MLTVHVGLPDEIWLQILQHLEPRTIVKLSVLNKRFQSLCTDPLLWKTLFETSQHGFCDWYREYQWKFRMPSIITIEHTTQAFFGLQTINDSLLITLDSLGRLLYWTEQDHFHILKPIQVTPSTIGSGVLQVNNDQILLSAEQEFYLRDLETSQLKHEFLLNSQITCFRFQDNLGFIGTTDKVLNIVDLRSPAPIGRLPQLEGTPLVLETFDDHLMCAGRFRSAALFDLRQNKLQQQVFTGTFSYTSLKMNSSVYVGAGHGMYGIVDIWNLESGQLKKHRNVIASHNAFVAGLSVGKSINGNYGLVSTGWDGRICLLNIHGQYVKTLFSHQQTGINHISIGNKRVFASCYDHLIGLELGSQQTSMKPIRFAHEEPSLIPRWLDRISNWLYG